MLIRLPNGTINKVAKIVPIIESYITFNGTKRLLSEPIDLKNPNERPNGVKIYFEKSVNSNYVGVFYSPEGVTIGNLSPEEVEYFCGCMLEGRHFDFSKYEFQKHSISFMDYVIDNGISNPYIVNNTGFHGLGTGMNFECRKFGEPISYAEEINSADEKSEVLDNDDEFDEYDEYDEDYDFITDED